MFIRLFKIKITFKEIFCILLILELSLFAWLPLTTLAIRGAGFTYLTKEFQTQYGSILSHLGSFNWFAVLTGIIFSKFYGVNLNLYFWTELIFMMLINIFFFYFILALTKKLIVAFSATLMLSVNYFGSYDMLAGGIYAYFQERIPGMLLLIPSFIFLHLFLEQSKRKYYILSIVFFFLGIGLQHWGVLFTSPYLFYPFFWYLFYKYPKYPKALLESIILGASYLIVSGFFVSVQYKIDGGLAPSWGFFGFLIHPLLYHYPEDILRQLVYWSSYVPIFQIFMSGFPLRPSTPLYFFVTPNHSLYYTPYIIVAYLIASVIIYIRLPQFRAMLLTIIFAVGAIFYLNAYFGEYNIPTQAGTNRYLYLPTYLLVIFWALFLWAIFWKTKGKKMILGLAFVGLYYVLNVWLIRDSFNWQLDHNMIALQTWNHIVDRRIQLSEKTLFIVPTAYTDPNMLLFLNEQLGKDRVFYIRDIDNWEKSRQSYQSVIKLEYNNDCKCLVEKNITAPDF